MKATIKSLGIKAKRLVTELAKSGNWTSHPNGYSGTGRHVSKTADHAATLTESLELIGMAKGRHFSTGNDAPRGGWSGEFVTLLPAGRRLKVIADIRRSDPVIAKVEPRRPSLALAEQLILDSWIRDGATHPCPEDVLAVKQKSQLSWRTLSQTSRTALHASTK
jgi:hypothetical protein